MKAWRVSTHAEAKKLTTRDLYAGARELTSEEREIVLSLLFLLGELDARREYKPHASLWQFCLKELRLHESQAFLRVKGARLIRKYPQAIPRLRDGRLTLSALVALRKVLNPKNAATLFEQVEGKSKQEILQIAAAAVAKIVPRNSIKDVPARVIKVPSAIAELRRSDIESAAAAGAGPAGSDAGKELPQTFLVFGGEDISEMRAASATQCQVTITAPREFREVLQELAAHLSHVIPDGDLSALIQYSVNKTLTELRKKKGLLSKEATAGAPKPTEAPANEAAPKEAAPPKEAQPIEAPPGQAPVKETAQAPLSEAKSPTLHHTERSYLWDIVGQESIRRPHIPAELRRQVWARDRGCCQFRVPGGGICGSLWQCEVDHIIPVARSGATTLENLRVLCKAHNLQAAREVFGDEFVDRKIEQSRTDAERRRSNGGKDPPPEEPDDE